MEEVRIIAVVGVKGGCGATLIAANLAAGLSEARSVCAIDLDFSRGDLAGILDLEPVRALPEILGSELDAPRIRGCALTHPDHFSVLGQPSDLSRLVNPSLNEVNHLLTVAQSAWDTLVLDVGSRMNHALVAAVMRADAVVLVSTHDVLALRNLVRMRALLTRRLAIPNERIRIVLNRVSHGASAIREELVDVADFEVAARVRKDDAAASLALAAGRSVAEVAPRSSLARDMLALKNTVLGEAPVSQPWHLPWIGVSK